MDTSTRLTETSSELRCNHCRRASTSSSGARSRPTRTAPRAPSYSGSANRRAGLDEPLVWVRAVHFAATISLTGTVLFLALIAEPVFRGTHAGGEVPARVRSWLAWIEWGSLVVVVVSGAAWLILKAAQMGDVPWQAVFSEDLIPMVLWGTDFGQDWIARLVLAALLVPTLLAAQPARASYRPALVAACVLGAALVGTLAWAGHAAATTGAMGAANISSDILHLVAAAAWVG